MGTILNNIKVTNDKVFEYLYMYRTESFPKDFTREMIIEVIKMKLVINPLIDSVVVGANGEFYACSKAIEAEWDEITEKEKKDDSIED